MSIPKKLHYVWLGNEKPKEAKKIINGWKKILGPKWEIKEWNENNFDMNSHKFTKYHFKRKNWSFVSDYIRMYAIYNEGGFYLDTDVELIKSLDSLLKYKGVFSKNWQINFTASTAGAIKGHFLMKKYLKAFDSWFIKVTQPYIMASDIMTAVIYNSLKLGFKKETEKIEDNIFLDEKILQLPSEKGIAIHYHHDNWKGKKNEFDDKFWKRKLKVSQEPLTNKRIRKTKKDIKKTLFFIKKHID